MRNFLSIAVVILLLPGLVLLAAEEGLPHCKDCHCGRRGHSNEWCRCRFFSAGEEALTAAQMFVVGTGAAVGVGYVQCAGGQDNVSFEGCGRGSGSRVAVAVPAPVKPPQPPMWQTGKLAVALSETNSAAPIPAFPRRPFVARMSDLTAIVRPAMSAPRIEPVKWPLPITPPAPIYRAPSVSHRLTVAARPMLPPTNAMAPARSLPLDSGCATPDITLTVPSFVEYGKECLITSKVNNATSCSIDGTNVTVPNGTYKTPPIVATANFTMVCKNGSVVTASKTVTCRINPTFQEF